MSDIRPFDEKDWNRFKEERQAYLAAGGTGSGLPKPSITTMDLKGKFAKGDDWSFSIFEDCDLTGANLESANLQHCHFKGADLSGSNLKGVDLTGSVLTQASLSGSDCSQASLSSANLIATDASECNFDGADFENATLFNADFSDSSFIDADLSKAQAEGANFTQANLIRADLGSAGMSGTDFSDANLERANLSGTNLKGAQLTQANFFEADLIKTDMTGAITLGMNIGGANLTNANLPEEVEDFSGLKIIEESSKILRTLFLLMMSVVAFSLLTIASTTYVQLLTNSSSFPLPIIGTPVSIQQFYLIAPFGIAGLFLYFHLYLLRHYRLIAKLPAVFPDGTPFDERLYPWMFNTWTKKFFNKLRSQDKLADALTQFIIIFLGWMLVPSLLLVFMARYVVSHYLTITEIHFWLTVSVLVLAFYLLVVLEKSVFKVSLGWTNKILRLMWATCILAASIFLFFVIKKSLLKGNEHPGLFFNVACFLCFLYFTLEKSVFGIRSGWKSNLVQLSLIGGIFTGVILLWNGLGFITFKDQGFFQKIFVPNIVGKDISFRPENWDPKKPLEGVKGANLEEKIMSLSLGMDSFLVKANLKSAILLGADFSKASLEETSFENADLRFFQCLQCGLTGAKLDGADLSSANFDRANLNHTTFMGTKIGATDFTEASLVGADFRGAKNAYTNYPDEKEVYKNARVILKDTDLKYAYMTDVKGMLAKHIKPARNWKWALFDDKVRKELGFTDDDLIERLPQIVKGHHPEFSAEEVKKKVTEWLDFYGLTNKSLLPN